MIAIVASISTTWAGARLEERIQGSPSGGSPTQPPVFALPNRVERDLDRGRVQQRRVVDDARGSKL